ncbi:hypothetical protein DEO72_LG8g1161 [Vigna unguiculata]|uniref:Uncharacterized protein n=1 Tax=Vigna unguiculata TaxID=3917 RepID=A0A4D6MNN7_VIGUN|nr:hypothetical protein DEO72_LG8g1161 [Vigna unguiculata]
MGCRGITCESRFSLTPPRLRPLTSGTAPAPPDSPVTMPTTVASPAGDDVVIRSASRERQRRPPQTLTARPPRRSTCTLPLSGSSRAALATPRVAAISVQRSEPPAASPPAMVSTPLPISVLGLDVEELEGESRQMLARSCASCVLVKTRM